MISYRLLLAAFRSFSAMPPTVRRKKERNHPAQTKKVRDHQDKLIKEIVKRFNLDYGDMRECSSHDDCDVDIWDEGDCCDNVKYLTLGGKKEDLESAEAYIKASEKYMIPRVCQDGLVMHRYSYLEKSEKGRCDICNPRTIADGPQDEIGAYESDGGETNDLSLQ